MPHSNAAVMIVEKNAPAVKTRTWRHAILKTAAPFTQNTFVVGYIPSQIEMMPAMESVFYNGGVTTARKRERERETRAIMVCS